MIKSEVPDRPSSNWSLTPSRVKSEEEEAHHSLPTKRQRTSEDFFTFCSLILEYENYESIKQEDLRSKNSSPLGSMASVSDSGRSDSLDSALNMSSTSSSDERKGPELESDEDSHDLITCFCMKPFAGRPMIECSECLTWIHLSCAKIRRNHIPEEFICQHCRETKHTARRSQRDRRRIRM